MKAFIALLFLCSFNIHASVNELFGPSAGSIAIGNQAESESAANNMIASSLLGHSSSTQFSFNLFYIDTHFRSINNIVLQNDVTTVNDYKIGDIEVNVTPTLLMGIHFSTPLFAGIGPKLNLSIISPTDRLLEIDTGDTYQPRYIFYGNRYMRPSINLSLAQSFGRWSYGVGVITGIQSNGETRFLTRFATTSGPSYGKINFNATPSIGLTASASKKINSDIFYFSYQQEMKSKLENAAFGETEIIAGRFPFEFQINSLLYFDPHTLRIGHTKDLQRTQLFSSLEYQHWENYESSTIKITSQNQSVKDSIDYEKLRPQNIFIPKIGISYQSLDNVFLKAGYFYRPSPIKHTQLKNAGNSIDPNKHVASIGMTYIFKVFGASINWDTSYQSHILQNRKIVKTLAREDGDTSEGQGKIGSPGYRIGGMIHVLSTGLSWKY